MVKCCVEITPLACSPIVNPYPSSPQPLLHYSVHLPRLHHSAFPLLSPTTPFRPLPNMYSQQGGRPSAGAPKVQNRYMKGRLPEGVDFAAYPGRSSTPLPTAESKSAERINQLKIWNEAATSDDKRRLNAAKGIGSGPNNSSARRTDSFKDAKDRHSASFHGSPPSASSNIQDPNSDQYRHVVPDAIAHPPSYHRTAVGTVGKPMQRNNDMFADRSDSESEEEYEDTHGSVNPQAVNPAADRFSGQPQTHWEHQRLPSAAPPPRPVVSQNIPRPVPPSRITNNNITNKPQSPAQPLPPGPKESKGCCTIM